MLPRSYLFVPANRPERFAKAIASGADAVIVDLEDSVADPEKNAARRTMMKAWGTLRSHACEAHCALLIRVNRGESEVAADDLDCCDDLRPDGLVIPKADCRQSLEEIEQRLKLPLFPLVETARGVQYVDEIAVATGVVRLLFGTLDLMLDLDVQDDDAPLHYARGRIAVASRAAGLAAPVDGVCTDLQSADRLAFEVERARQFGFGAKLSIHPAQLPAIHEGIGVTKEQLDWAQMVLDLAEASRGGVAALGGKMIDAPVIAMARRMLGK
jgi:citrate lyase subunit beta/citryl-CoA lyase